jgi:alpha-1,3-glucan synthase
MLGATSIQITLLSGQNWQKNLQQNNLQQYVLGCVFLVASTIWFTLYRLKPSIYVLAFPWTFYALAFFLIGLPSVSSVFEPGRRIIIEAATLCYTVASAASFLYFGLNFGEDVVRMRPRRLILCSARC